MSFTSPCSSKNLPWSRSVGLQSTNKIKSSQAQSKPVWSSGSSAEWVILMHRAKPNTNTSKQKLPLFIFSWGGSREKRQNKNRKQKTSFVVRRTIYCFIYRSASCLFRALKKLAIPPSRGATGLQLPKITLRSSASSSLSSILIIFNALFLLLFLTVSLSSLTSSSLCCD